MFRLLKVRLREGVLFILTFATFVYSSEVNCVFGDGKYDLAALDGPMPWNTSVQTINTENNLTAFYQYSPCRPISTGDCQGANLCRVINSQGSEKFTGSQFNLSDSGDGFWLTYVGPKCKSGNFKTRINFQCGTTLGSPKFTHSSGCNSYFLWRTSAACIEKPKRKQVACYVTNADGQKRDLSALTLKSGAHEVITSGPTKFYINVCDEIIQNKNCSSGSSACRQLGSEFIDFGRPNAPLKLDSDGNLLLIYTLDNVTNAKIPAGCTLQPRTEITFKCPDNGENSHLTEDQHPVLVSFDNCQYVVDWITQYACPIKQLSTKKCSLNEPLLGVDVNLTPLLKSADAVPYHAVGNVNNKNVDFYLNICGSVSSGVCNSQAQAVCKKSQSQPELGLGSSDVKTLRYVEGEVSLVYANGEKLSDDNAERISTVVNFWCNNSAGIGKPKFNQVFDSTYFFDWQTNAVCSDLAEGAQCRAVNDSKVVDLSPLVRYGVSPGRFAITTGVKDFANSQIILNVCGPVKISDMFSGCREGSAACLKKGNNEILSLGRFENPPQIVNGITKLMYIGGDACSEDKSKTISSEISFICSPGQLGLGPLLTDVSDDQCHFRFEWPTAYACVQAKHIGDNCRVHNNDLDIDFDLSPLKTLGTVNVTAGDYEYFLSICGEGNENLCNGVGKHSVCQVKLSNKSAVWNLGGPSDDIIYYDGFINLTYTNGTPYSSGNSRETTITFLCDPNANLGYPKFVKEENQLYSFKWYTSLTCTQKPIGCVVIDEAKHLQYDLASLTRLPGRRNWEVVDEKKKRKIYFNFCQSLVDPFNGCDPEAAVCITNFTSGEETVEFKNAGYPSKPTKDTETIITFTYTTENACVIGSERRPMMTVIHVICPDNGPTPKAPEYFPQMDPCKHMIFLESTAGCPTRPTTVNNNCKVKEPSTGEIFDLHELRGIYRVIHPDPKIPNMNISICGEKQSCGETKDQVAACSTDSKGNPLVIGLIDKVRISIQNREEVIIEYDGSYEQDTGKPSHVVKITLHCDPNVLKGPMVYTGSENDIFFFEMSTSVICGLTMPVAQCSVSDSIGNLYDLSSLARIDTNWEIEDVRSNHSDFRYYINFCRRLVPGPAIVGNCADGISSACQVGKDESYSLGRPGRPRVVSDGQITVRFTGGSPCHGGAFNRSMRILLECSEVKSDPIFLSETAHCEYIVNWKTPAACKIQHVVGKDCRVDDTQFDHVFDLSPLKTGNPYTITGNDHSYSISVCEGMNCNSQNDVGVCQKAGEQEINAGHANGNLSFDNGELTLMYSDGQANCHGKYSRTSYIRFVCGKDPIGKPMFLNESSNCTYFFVWPTNLACAPVTTSQCSVRGDDGRFYDLSSLTLHNGYHDIVYGNSKFLINVCQSVGQSKDSRCQYTSGVCLVNLKETDPKLRFTNLGSVHTGPYFQDGRLKLNYSFGEACVNGPSSEAIITFICDRSAKDSQPQFLQKVNCTWHFVWNTAAACPIQDGEQSNENCTVVNPNTGFKFDLTSLSKQDGYSIEDRSRKHHYLLNVCGNLKEDLCNGTSGVCQEEQSGVRKWSGGVGNSNLRYRDGALFLNYSNGTPCHQGKYNRSTVIKFTCASGNGVGQPEFIDESDNCTYYINWKTALACEKQVHCVVDNGSTVIDLSHLTRQDHYVAKDPRETLNKNVFVLSVCQPLNPLPQLPCPPEAAACQTSLENPNPINLGRVSSSPQFDQDGHVFIEYTGGSQCPTNSSATISTRLIFLCNRRIDLGYPEFLEMSDDDCEYIFQWETGYACPRKGNPHAVVNDGCVFTDEKTWRTFDLRSLVSKTPIESDETAFSICGTVSDNGPCAGASICKKSSTSLGSATSMSAVTVRNELTLTFNGSSNCYKDAGKNWSTEIRFACDRNAGVGKPVLQEEVGCTVYYQWKTNAVCQAVCTVTGKDGDLINLRPLAAMSHPWMAKDASGNEYWLNVCEGFKKGWAVPEQCSKDVTACTKSPGNSGNAEILGTIANQKLTLNETTGRVVLEYVGMVSTTGCSPSVQIHFLCGKTLGKPIFVSDSQVSGCRRVEFRWQTSAACGQKRRELEVNWMKGYVYDKTMDLSMNFSALMQKSFTANETRLSDYYVYQFELFTSQPTACGIKGVCQTKGTGFKRDIGLTDNAKFYHDGNDFLLEMQSLSHCGRNANKNTTTIIKFECDPSASVGQPEFTFESNDCNYNFNWRTVAVCFENMSVGVMQFSEGGFGSGKSSGMSVGAIFAIVGLLLVITVGVVYVVSKPSRRAVVSQKFRMLWHRTRRTPSFHYSRQF